MPISAKTNIGRKVDLTSEVTGVLPLANTDPSVATAVLDYYSPGIIASDGYAVTLTKDVNNKLPFLRLKAGENISINQTGNSLQITASSSVGGSGDMLKSVYDTDNRGYVDQAVLADTVSWSGVIGPPASFPPDTHTHVEADVTNLVTDLAARALTATLVNTSNSLTGGGSLAANRTLQLVNDATTPGNNYYYGTGNTGTKGWIADPYIVGGMSKAIYATNGEIGVVDTALLAQSVDLGAVTAGSIADGAVLTEAIGDGQVTGVKLSSTAVVSNLGYTPVNKVGDSMSGPLNITAVGPTINTSAWQNAQLLVQTFGPGTGNPVLGFGRSPGDGTGGGVAVYYTGLHNDFQLLYGDGTTGHLLSSNSTLNGANLIGPINGALLSAGSVPISALAAGSVEIAGVVKMYAGPNIPAGYLLCNGASYLIAQYPALFAAIGGYWGQVDSLHFNVPSMQNRTVMQTQLGIYAGGSATLTMANIPQHLHNVSGSDPGHTHVVDSDATTIGVTGGASMIYYFAPKNTGRSTTGIINTGYAGQAAPASFAVTPLHAGMYFIIKT